MSKTLQNGCEAMADSARLGYVPHGQTHEALSILRQA